MDGREAAAAAVSGGFGGAVSELARLAARRSADSRGRGARIRRLIRLSDEMLHDLEEANLAGVARLREEWRLRLEVLCADAPPGLVRRARRVRTPTAAIEVVFDVQELLLPQRASPPRLRV